MNVYDATRMVDSLVGEGYSETQDVNSADLIVLNTCHIRERASEKVFSELGKLNEQKSARAAVGKKTLIAVAGCVAQADGAEIIRRQPSVDIVIGTQSYHRLPEALQRSTNGSRIVITDFGVEDKFDALATPSPARIQSRGVTAFVTVQEGCDKFCAFCVVPYTRGIEVSRPMSKVVEEVEILAAAGVREVTLLGQNVNAWHGRGSDGRDDSLPALIARIAVIPGIARIRYTTSHPNDMDAALIEAHRDIPALMPFMHLPAQSGSDRILKAMNRKHSARDYLKIIERLRSARPDLAISSDFIVGFPGESEQDFTDTMDLIREVGFANSFSFKYSRRPGTPATGLSGKIEESIMSARLAELQTLLDEQRKAFNRSAMGKTIDVLFEKPGRYAGQLGGKTPYLQAIHVEGSTDLIGDVHRVEVVEALPNSLRGRIVAQS